MTTGFRPRRAKMQNCQPTYTYGQMAMNIGESPTAYHIELAVPGWTKDEISLNVKEGHLIVEGQASESEKTDEVRFHRLQLRKTDFTKSFFIPKDGNDEAITAKFDNGILRIAIEKFEKDHGVRNIAIS